MPGGETIDSDHINNVSIESTDSSSSVEEQKPDNSEKGEEVNGKYIYFINYNIQLCIFINVFVKIYIYIFYLLLMYFYSRI